MVGAVVIWIDLIKVQIHTRESMKGVTNELTFKLKGAAGPSWNDNTSLCFSIVVILNPQLICQ